MNDDGIELRAWHTYFVKIVRDQHCTRDHAGSIGNPHLHINPSKEDKEVGPKLRCIVPLVECELRAIGSKVDRSIVGNGPVVGDRLDLRKVNLVLISWQAWVWGACASSVEERVAGPELSICALSDR